MMRRVHVRSSEEPPQIEPLAPTHITRPFDDPDWISEKARRLPGARLRFGWSMHTRFPEGVRSAAAFPRRGGALVTGLPDFRNET